MNPQNKQICSMRPQYIQICFVCVCNTNRYACVCEMQIDVVWVCNENRYIVWIHNTTDMLYESEIKPAFCISLHTKRFALWFYITKIFLIGTQNKNTLYESIVLTQRFYAFGIQTDILYDYSMSRHVVWEHRRSTHVGIGCILSYWPKGSHLPFPPSHRLLSSV